MRTTEPPTFRRPTPLRTVDEPAVFADAHVVQATGGHPAGGYASVELLDPATVTVAEDRIEAEVSGGAGWVWLVDELEAVHHAASGPWTIFAVPGVRDYGVAVRPADADALRARIASLRPDLAEHGDEVDHAVAERPSAQPPVSLVGPDPTIELALPISPPSRRPHIAAPPRGCTRARSRPGSATTWCSTGSRSRCPPGGSRP